MAKIYDTKNPDRDTNFVIRELLDLPSLAEHIPSYAVFSDQGFMIEALEVEMTFGDISDMAKAFAENSLLPLYNQGDKGAPKFTDGNVTLTAEAKAAYEGYVENMFTAMVADPEHGGLDLPEVVLTSSLERFNSANMGWTMITTLTAGAYAAIRDYGSDELKEAILPGLVSGERSGAMDMTEPGAGTGLGATRAKAEPIEGQEGKYKISGDKIFITYGDHDATKNIDHLVLARTPDAPEGVKGISLFHVPKLIDGAENGITVAGMEHEKMGLHQSPTCSMNYDGAVGELIGKEHCGLIDPEKADKKGPMFTMMNEARLHVAIQAIGVVEAAYQNALAYAQERIVDDKPLIEKEDVRRKLLDMRSMVESGRAMVTFTAAQIDIAHKHPDAAEREKANALVNLLTPICKGHFTRRGVNAVREGLEVLGGYGYSEEYPLAEMDRDLAITTIYEGVNAVQALAVLKEMGSIKAVTDEIREFADANRDNEEVAELVSIVEAGAKAADEQAEWLVQNKGEMLAEATEFMHLLGKVTSSYMMAKSATIAHEKLQSGELDAKDKSFYEGKIDVAEFQVKRVLQKEIEPVAARRTGKATLRMRDVRPETELEKPTAAAKDAAMEGEPVQQQAAGATKS